MSRLSMISGFSFLLRLKQRGSKRLSLHSIKDRESYLGVAPALWRNLNADQEHATGLLNQRGYVANERAIPLLRCEEVARGDVMCAHSSVALPAIYLRTTTAIQPPIYI